MKQLHPTVSFFMEHSSSTMLKDRRIASAIVSTLRECKLYTPRMIDWWLYVTDESSILDFTTRKVLTSLLCRDGWIQESRKKVFDAHFSCSDIDHNPCLSESLHEYYFERGYKTDEMFETCAKEGEYMP